MTNMPSLNPSCDYANLRQHSRKENSATVIEIGPASNWQSTGSFTSMSQRRIESSPTDWDSRVMSTHTSRPTSRADSSGSNVSLKDTVDVFVDDKFHKSYNINYEPVRIRIGDENDTMGHVYTGKVSSSNYGPVQSMPVMYDNDSRSGNVTRSSYHQNTKELHNSSNYGNQSNQSYVTVSSPSPAKTSGSKREYSIPIRQESYSDSQQAGTPTNILSDRTNSARSSHNQIPKKVAMGKEFAIPIHRQDAPYEPDHRGRTSIPVGNDYGSIPLSGRHTSVFSPDSGRDSVELPVSRGGYVATPLPDTPIGGFSDIVINNPEFTNKGKRTDYDRGMSNVDNRRKDHSSPGRHSVRFNTDSADNVRGYATGHGEPTGTYVRDADFSTTPVRETYSSYPVSSGTYVRDDPENVPIGDSKQFSISKVEVPGSSIVNSPSLTYAVDDTADRTSSRASRGRTISAASPVPTAPQDNMRPSSRNRSLSRGDSTGRPASRVGLPTYERDYVDRPGNDADLDNLSDDERNDRLQQKKAIFPQNRNAALVAELKETTNNISSNRRNRIEKEFSDKLEKKEFLAMLDRLTAEQFMPQVPYYDEEGFQIAEYKRNFLAKQAANQARREFQARIDNGEDLNQIQQSPEWKRLFIDNAKEEYDGTPFKVGMQNKEALQISLSKNRTGNKLQPWQLELKRLERFHN